MHFIVKLFPEITIKSAPVRKRFTKQLRENLRDLLKPLDKRITVVRDWDKIEVIAEGVEEPALTARVAEVLTHTPGVAHFVEVVGFAMPDMTDAEAGMHQIFLQVLPFWQDKLAGKTFCVRVKRNGDHAFTSIEIERYVGGGLNQHTAAAGVRLKNPDITVKMEIHKDKFYVVLDQQQGLGGFPLGSQEPVLSLVSGGFDSTVASYLMMKRGIRTHFCFFNLGGRAHEVAVKEVAYFLWQKYGRSHRVMFVTIPFEDVVGEILEKVDNSHMGVILKRMMLRAATRLAADMEIGAVVTGEAIAQVSSQTLTNLSVIDEVTDTLVLRPLIVMDKTDIINLSRQIGTEEFSANIPEYCGVISKKPTTRAKLDRVIHEESKFDFARLDAALDARRMVGIDEVINDLDSDIRVDLVADLVPGQVVIDIRHPDEEELAPLALAGAEVLHIPFFRLNTAFPELPKDKQYLLYCEKGVMSQLHAAHLKDAGYVDVGVYRPQA